MLIPQTIESIELSLTAEIDETCAPTDNCVHVTLDGKIGGATSAAITKPDKFGCYLFFWNEEGEMTDTYHESIDEAKNQAEFEYSGIHRKWQQAT